MTRRARAVGWIAASLAAVAILALSLRVQEFEAEVDPSTAAVRAAAQGALSALYYDDFPPPDYRGGPLASPAAAAIRERAVAGIQRYFTPPLQARYEPLLLNYVESIGTSDWDAAGGFTALDWKPVVIHGDQAAVGVRTMGWVLRRGGQLGIAPDATYRIESTFDWGFTLRATNGQWQVDALNGTCVEGCP